MFYHYITAVFLFLYVLSPADMVKVPAGSYDMGTERGESDERPVHNVYVSTFLIDKYEVTYSQYDSCVAAGRCAPPHYRDGKCTMWISNGIKRVKVPDKYTGDEFPVVCVSWRQARSYCRYKGKRLPTEAEWEKAALGGRDVKYSWGNTFSGDKCVSGDNRRPEKTGYSPPNGYGIHDMTGNVWEWVSDRYEKDYYKFSEERDPKGPGASRYRTIRGGGWYSSEEMLRIKNRHWFTPEAGEVSVGFRCAKSG